MNPSQASEPTAPAARGTGRTSLGGPNHCWKDIADTAPSSADKMPHSDGAPGRAGALGRGRPVERARSTLLSGGGRHGVLVDLPGGLPPRDGRPPRVVPVLDNLFASAARHAPQSNPIRTAARNAPAEPAASPRLDLLRVAARRPRV